MIKKYHVTVFYMRLCMYVSTVPPLLLHHPRTMARTVQQAGLPAATVISISKYGVLSTRYEVQYSFVPVAYKYR